MKKSYICSLLLFLAILTLSYTGEVCGLSPMGNQLIDKTSGVKTDQTIFQINGQTTDPSITIRPMTEAEKQMIDSDAVQNSKKIAISTSPMTDNEKEEFLTIQDNYQSSSQTYLWSSYVDVPQSNSAGTNGQQLGFPFITAPSDVLVIETGKFETPSSMINISAEYSNGMDSSWITGVHEFEKVFVNAAGYQNYQIKIKVSSCDQPMDTVFFHVYP